MPAKPPVQYTIRGIPRDVDRELRRKSRERGISLNQLLLEELGKATGISTQRVYRSVKSVAGKWRDDPAFDRALEDQRQVDQDLWR